MDRASGRRRDLTERYVEARRAIEGKVWSEAMAPKEDLSKSGPAHLRGTEVWPLWDKTLGSVASGSEAPS